MGGVLHRVAAVGDTLNGRYPVNDIIASGGQGIILAATDTNTGSPVAIKQLRTDPTHTNHASELGRFQRSATIRVGHPAVLDPIDSFADSGWFIVFPMLTGKDLDTVLKHTPGPVPTELAVNIIRQITEGIGAAHKKCLIHRDIKPANIFLSEDGRAQILDFGIARNIREQTFTASSCVIGSPPYMAPEQFVTSAVKPTADLYALGMILYLLLTGVHPRPGITDEELARQAQTLVPTQPALLNTTISPALNDVCTRLLSINPAHRPQTAGDLIAELDAVMQLTVRCLACGHRLGMDQVCGGCGRRFPNTPYRLDFTKGPAAGQSFMIPEGVFECGRHQLCPGDLRISRRQLGIGCGDTLRIRNASNPAPPNPTLINGSPATESVLITEGTRISIAANDAIVRIG